MPDSRFAALRTISNDLKELLGEAREKGSSLFTSAASAEHFFTPQPSPLPSTAPKQARALLASSTKNSAQDMKVAGKPKPPQVPPSVDPIPPPPKKESAQDIRLDNTPASQPQETRSTFFDLEPLPALVSSFTDQGLVTKKIQKLFPGWKLAEHPPSDEEAVKIASAWKIRAAATEIIVLLFSSKPAVRSFLHNFASALQRVIGPAQLIDARSIEKEDMWEAVLGAPCLTAIYAPPLETWNTPLLLKHVKTIPAAGESF